MQNKLWRNAFFTLVLSIPVAVPPVHAHKSLSQKSTAVTDNQSVANAALPQTSDNGVIKAWGDIDYTGDPWVSNISRPNRVTNGLNNRHISLWASHGRYFDQKKNCWKWQRPNLFCTTEDLFTQTIVIPYLIPMLENAGAVVFTPRERDWQTNEVIVDNDDAVLMPYYTEHNVGKKWKNARTKGFAIHRNVVYRDHENPFEAGSTRKIKASSKAKSISDISYQPDIPESGRYAVYVSYPTLRKSVSDAEYTVCHQGQRTVFHVNQKMGGGTWVYLGTFDFDKGCRQENRVIVSNHSAQKGYVCSDAVRFGGGMGNIERGGTTSGMPRTLEGSRYYAQWAGAPYSVYSSKNGEDDYADDINARSYMTNWLAGGSVYMPTVEGRNVPIELSLAIHSDAGFSPDGQSIVGSLAICTTDFNDGRLSSGISRMTSKDFASSLLNNVTTDMQRTFGKWNRRYLWDRNYSETRNPEVPSAILETMSHQNFPDMKMGQDPNFRFALARSIYKTILRYVARQHGTACAVTPLRPRSFNIVFSGEGKVKLNWAPQYDPQEPTATPTSYNVYVAMDQGGFDNGTNISTTSCEIQLKPGHQYNFKVTAVNSGGESFPSMTLSACYQPGATKTILVVNGFNRLSSPAVVDTESQQGFDLKQDIGVSYGLTAGWSGYQSDFDRSKMGREDGLGYSGNELAGSFIAGNDFSGVVSHAAAISQTGKYNIASCSSAAVENGKVDLNRYAGVDYILGLEKDDGHSLIRYKTFPRKIQQRMEEYLQHHGRMLISGSYIGSDMTAETEKEFLSRCLKLSYQSGDSLTDDPSVSGMGISFDILRHVNKDHYAAAHPEILHPAGPGFSILQYHDGASAAVAYDGSDYKCVAMGFPFECIATEGVRSSLMQGILNFLMK